MTAMSAMTRDVGDLFLRGLRGWVSDVGVPQKTVISLKFLSKTVKNRYIDSGEKLRRYIERMARERIELNGHDESFLFEGGSVPSFARAKVPVSSGRSRSNGSADSSTFDLREGRTQGADRQDPASRAIDIGDDEEEAQFLRTQKRVPVRRGPIPKKTASWIKTALIVAGIATPVAALGYAASHYGTHASRFYIGSSDNIEVTGVSNASRAQVMEVARQDVIALNVFKVSLDDCREKLEQIPWVESATVMRLLPNRIVISITERRPVAFVQIGSKIHLIDAGGVVMGLPANRQTKYSFPVIHGIADADPLSSRAAVMKIYNRMAGELSSGEGESAQFMRQVSEVDLSDPEDVKATVNDAGGTVVIHLGMSDFLERYKLFAAHIGEWRQQYKDVESVDLRWEGQIVVNPDTPRTMRLAPPPAIKPDAVKPVAKPAAKPGVSRRRDKARRARPAKKK
jgi:cell division protein FtsQ